MKTLIVNIKRNSLDDGPGIRTAIFFKGCPLSCVWCQNPETKSASQELSFEKDQCIKCGKCIKACKKSAISKKYIINREICDLCGSCIDACLNESLKFVGKEYSVEDLVEILLKDKVFYDNSGGGITLTGGEPTVHLDYLHALLKEIKKNNVHVCLETCGYYNQKKFNDLILPYLDLIYFDVKIIDDNKHETYCKVSNKKIFENFENLIKNNNTEVLPRIPLIPNITTDEENLQNIANYLKSLNIKKIGLLPYNPLWIYKTGTIGVELEYKHSNWMKMKEKDEAKAIFSSFEFREL